MNLNVDQNILLAKKASYAEQLLYYAKLCQEYQTLAEEAKKYHAMSPATIEQRYAEPLSKLITSTDLAKTLEELSRERVFSEDYMGSKYSQKELETFKNFGETAEIFKSFQESSAILDKVYNAKTSSQRNHALTEFHSYLSDPNQATTVRNFDKFLSTHSPRYIGNRYFLVANKGLSIINEVDSEHIPLSPFIIKQNLSPDKFGAILAGPRSITSKIEAMEQEQGYEHTNHFNPDNWDLSNNSRVKVNSARRSLEHLEHSAGEKAFTLGSAIKNPIARTYKAHKGTVKKALAIALVVGALIGGAHQAGKEITAHNLDLGQTSYEQTISGETRSYIENIMQELNLQENSFNPEYEDAKAIEEHIDLVLDKIVEDQVTTAFENYHKNWKVTGVESWFNKKYQASSPNSEPRNFEFVTVNYVDENGKDGQETIGDFRSDFIFQNHLKQIFNLEEDIDLDSPIYAAFRDDGTRNYLDKAHSIEEVMNYLENAVNITRHVASFGMEHGHGILGDPYLKSTLPNKADSKTTDDDAR